MPAAPLDCGHGELWDYSEHFGRLATLVLGPSVACVVKLDALYAFDGSDPLEGKASLRLEAHDVLGDVLGVLCQPPHPLVAWQQQGPLALQHQRARGRERHDSPTLIHMLQKLLRDLLGLSGNFSHVALLKLRHATAAGVAHDDVYPATLKHRPSSLPYRGHVIVDEARGVEDHLLALRGAPLPPPPRLGGRGESLRGGDEEGEDGVLVDTCNSLH
mmetsp:Transcript_4186/g.10154  ORF Transcript_4186/g.10154 Transcript_4186/m.10154 type:complete len:216 (-) Transcript_4186:612-1259(-)